MRTQFSKCDGHAFFSASETERHGRHALVWIFGRHKQACKRLGISGMRIAQVIVIHMVRRMT